MIIKTDRIRGGIVGMLVGDALGVPYEFTRSYHIPHTDLIEMVPPKGFHQAHNVPAGTWSDDGAQALCLLASLLECKDLNTSDLGTRFVRWYQQGYMAVDNRVFDVGSQTARALHKIQAGHPPDLAGGTTEQDNGNGSLMRVLPLALWHRGSDKDLIHMAMRQSALTHGHIRAKVACALYCMWARCILEGQNDINLASERVDPHLNAMEIRELRRIMSHRPDGFAWGSGYVLDSFASAREAMNQPSYEAVVKQAIAYGRDTDTTACIAGGLAGLLYGESNIPQRWLDTLRGRDILDPLLNKLVEHYEHHSH